MAADVIRVDWGAWGTCGQGVRALVGTRAFLLRDEENDTDEPTARACIGCPDGLVACDQGSDYCDECIAEDARQRGGPPSPPPPRSTDPPMLPGMQTWAARFSTSTPPPTRRKRR